MTGRTPEPRALAAGRPYKPLDFGNGLVAGSVAADGRLFSLGSYHPEHGFMVLGAAAPLADERRHDQAAVRAYRAALAGRDAPGFGLRLPALTGQTPVVFLLADAIPHSRWQVGPVTVTATTWAPEPGGRPVAALVQRWRFANQGDAAVTWVYSWEGRLGLARASYSQLTESGRLPMPGRELSLTFDGRRLLALAPALGAAALLLGLPAGRPWQEEGEGPLEIAFQGEIEVSAGGEASLALVVALGLDAAEAEAVAAAAVGQPPGASLATAVARRQARRWRPPATTAALPEGIDRLAQRARAYVLDCCALPVGEGVCLLTDHRILPLSWTRDAYYLLQGVSWPPGDRANLELTRRHLLWLFETAERTDGYWGRAYLANGQPKDRIFQLDQQCYPLLELAEYGRQSGDEATLARLRDHAPAVLESILARRAGDAALFATEETPADDPLPFPYHFSSHVLLWHTLKTLAGMEGQRLPGPDLDRLAAEVKAAVWGYFVTEWQGERLFAYATDGRGRRHLYHDANDLPLALAPRWGFCPADDPVWRATLAFAFSPANKGGFYDGRVGGLGSIHTAGPWPLGDVQDYLRAGYRGDAAGAEAALGRLATTACWDGALPEARDPESGAVRSRHWFAWPGAALLAALPGGRWQEEVKESEKGSATAQEVNQR